MKKYILALALLFSTNAFALEICVTGAGMGYDDLTGEFSYMTGIGPDGATPNPITVTHPDAAEVLTKAAAEMKSEVQVCMKGSMLKLSNERFQFMVYAAEEKPY